MLGSFHRASLELAPLSGCRDIAKQDAASLSTDPEKFVSENLFAYYVLVNTWLMYIRMYSQYGWMRVGELASKRGIIPLIAEAADASEELIKGDAITSPLFRQIVGDVMRPHITWGMPKVSEKLINEDPMASALQVLRYPKRFSPLGADKVQSASLRQFLATERRSKRLQATSCFVPFGHNFPLMYTRDVMSRIINWDNLCDHIEAALADPRNAEFTAGTARDAKTPLASKLRATLRSNPEYFRPVMGIPLVGGMPEPAQIWYNQTARPDNYILRRREKYGPTGAQRYEEVREVRVAAVPKSYKAARIIAMEDSYRQARAHMIFSIMDRYLPDGIQLHDQTQNQELARSGSLSGDIATIDMSSASDTITRSLFWELFPLRFANLVYPYLGTHHTVNGKKRIMQMMATSGNSLTFILESLVFYAIDVASHEFSQQVCGEEAARIADCNMPVPSVYGDDQIIWSADYDVTVHFLEALGFIVNESKSYTGDSPFRESCGSEWYVGADVSSVYFPRRPIRGTATEKSVRAELADARRDSFTGEMSTSLSSLISLQHRLFDVCQDASLFLAVIAKETKPTLSSSPAGSRWDDLWDYMDDSRVAYAPGVRRMVTEGILPENLSSEQREVYMRTLRLLPTVSYANPSGEEIPSLVRRLYDVYKYQEFLRNGPRYADEHLRSLGISERPLRLEEVYFTPTVKWRWIEASEA